MNAGYATRLFLIEPYRVISWDSKKRRLGSITIAPRLTAPEARTRRLPFSCSAEWNRHERGDEHRFAFIQHLGMGIDHMGRV
jgi:hypothetical protein